MLAPLDSLRVYGVDFLFRDYLANRFATVDAMNAELATTFADFADVLPPQESVHYLDFLTRTRPLRWEFAVRNYLSVIDYMAVRMPEPITVCPEDRVRLAWSRDPRATDAGQVYPRPPGWSPAPGRHMRWSYSSSYEVGAAAWDTLASVPAVRNRRVYSVVGDFVVVAGPRLVEGAEAMARVLHPEAFK
jgi:hypothetical protein